MRWDHRRPSLNTASAQSVTTEKVQAGRQLHHAVGELASGITLTIMSYVLPGKLDKSLIVAKIWVQAVAAWLLCRRSGFREEDLGGRNLGRDGRDNRVNLYLNHTYQDQGLGHRSTDVGCLLTLARIKARKKG